MLAYLNNINMRSVMVVPLIAVAFITVSAKFTHVTLPLPINGISITTVVSVIIILIGIVLEVELGSLGPREPSSASK